MQNERTDQGPWLVLDASHPQVEVGILGTHGWLSRASGTEQALSSIFRYTQDCLHETGLNLSHISGYIHCSGPGSMLGIRLSAMAIKTWRGIHGNTPLYTYTSLDLARRSYAFKNPGTAFDIIADWKRNTWHHMPFDQANISAITSEELSVKANNSLLYLSQRKSWQAPPADAQAIAYSIESLPQILLKQADFLRSVEDPDVFQHEAPVYQKWTPSRHGTDNG
ncbi:MAG: hypothetical protein ACPGN3_02885 [Opitutales bacterium]